MDTTPSELEIRFYRDLATFGAARIGGADYRLVPYGSDNQPAVERSIDGQREIITGWRSVPFPTLTAAHAYACQDAKERFIYGRS